MSINLVSVVIPSYNHSLYIKEAIQSVIDQDYDEIELVIIDDGSKDNSVAIISDLEELCRKRFVRFVFIHRPNKGLTATLNEAISHCKGRYLVMMASDDKMLESKIRRQVGLISEMPNNVAGIFGSAYIMDEHSQQVGSLNVINRRYDFKDILLHRHNLPACTQMLRLDYLQTIGPLPHEYAIEDWYMWLALTQRGYVLASVNDFFSYYRVHSTNTSSNHELMNSERYKLVAAFGAAEKSSLMNLAYACCDLAASLQAITKRLKIKKIGMALAKSPLVVFERKFYIAIARVLL